MRIHPSALIVEEWSLNEPLEVVPLGFGCFASVSVFPPHSLLVLLHVLAMNQTKKKHFSSIRPAIVMVKPVNLKKQYLITIT